MTFAEQGLALWDACHDDEPLDRWQFAKRYQVEIECAIQAQKERDAGVDFILIIYEVLKKHGKSKRLALHDLRHMAKGIAAAIREEPR